jgi:hypothetical protein
MKQNVADIAFGHIHVEAERSVRDVWRRNWAEDILYLCTFESTRAYLNFHNSLRYKLRCLLTTTSCCLYSRFLSVCCERAREKINYFDDIVGSWSGVGDKKRKMIIKIFLFFSDLSSVCCHVFEWRAVSTFYFMSCDWHSILI